MVLLDDDRILVTIHGWIELAQDRLGERDGYGGRRRQLRYAWREPMEMLVEDEIIEVISRDVSESGIGIVCRERLDRTVLHVHIRRDQGDPWIKGRVSHVTRSLTGYLIGLDFALGA